MDAPLVVAHLFVLPDARLAGSSSAHGDDSSPPAPTVFIIINHSKYFAALHLTAALLAPASSPRLDERLGCRAEYSGATNSQQPRVAEEATERRPVALDLLAAL